MLSRKIYLSIPSAFIFNIHKSTWWQCRSKHIYCISSTFYRMCEATYNLTVFFSVTAFMVVNTRAVSTLWFSCFTIFVVLLLSWRSTRHHYDEIIVTRKCMTNNILGQLQALTNNSWFTAAIFSCETLDNQIFLTETL